MLNIQICIILIKIYQNVLIYKKLLKYFTFGVIYRHLKKLHQNVSHDNLVLLLPMLTHYDVTLPIVSNFKDLDIHFQDIYIHLKMHIFSIYQKSYNLINQLFKIYLFILTLAYNNYGIRIIEYYSIIWTPNIHAHTYMSLLDKL